LRDYLRVIRQHRVLIAVFLVVFGGGALTLALRADEVYEAESSVRLRDLSADLSLVGEQVIPAQDSAFEGSRAAEELKDLAVAERARKALGTTIPARALAATVKGQIEVKTGFVVVQAKAPDGGSAAAISNAFSKALVDQITAEQDTRLRKALSTVRGEYSAQIKRARRQAKKVPGDTTQSLLALQYQQQIGRLRGLIDYGTPAQIVKSASVPSTPTSPKPIRDLLLGLILGLVLGIVAAFVRDSLDRRLRGADEIREHMAMPIIATLSADALGAAAVSANGTRPIPDNDFEAVRILRTNISLLDVDRTPRVLAVTSAVAEEGKSTIASNLAVAHALAGSLVLLIECDLRRPSLAHRLGLQQSPGLTDFLSGNAGPGEVLQRLEVPATGGAEAATIVVVSAGTQVPRPAELLGSQRMKVLLQQVREVYDVVILDTAPLLPVVDTRALLTESDAVVIAARSRRTTRDQANALREALHPIGDTPRGVVVTGVTAQDESYGYYSYAYGSSPS
jgi:capsular exopolysaccharide synthesis family protein